MISKFSEYEESTIQQLVSDIAIFGGKIKALGEPYRVIASVPIIHNHKYAVIGPSMIIQIVREYVDGDLRYALLVDDYFMRLSAEDQKFLVVHEIAKIRSGYIELIYGPKYSIDNRFDNWDSPEANIIYNADNVAKTKLKMSKTKARNTLINVHKVHMQALDNLDKTYSDVSDDVNKLREQYGNEFNNRTNMIYM